MVEPSTRAVSDLESRKDRAKGAILGSFIGDSAGSALEFKTKVTKTQLNEAMKMPGMLGPFKLAPGQVTDDGELTMAQLWALS
jgi:ADP-ribosyl-[dinitrogen reductase] hydrolase